MGGPFNDNAQTGRRDRLIRERVHDPYKSGQKLKEPTVCTSCHALFHKGRWTWDPAPQGAHESLCPACTRIRDRVPAGYLTLSGDFFSAHRDEILNLVHNKEQAEKGEHPMNRIMDVEERDEGTVVTFTDIHLPRSIGDALESAYEGNLDYEYTDETNILRVRWSR